MNTPIVIALLLAMATFLLIGAYAHDCLDVARLPEKNWKFVLTK